MKHDLFRANAKTKYEKFGASMFGEKGYDLLKDLFRSKDNLPPFNDEGLRRVLQEMNNIYEENQKDVNSVHSGDHTITESFFPTIALRHATLERNKRCVLAYMHNRLKRIRKMRWELGSILPPTVKVNLSKNELDWFIKYSKILAMYMATIGDGTGLNITQDLRPPQSFYIEVKSNEDYGRFELDSGDLVVLKKNGVYHLPRSQCEVLIRQGILEHIT